MGSRFGRSHSLQPTQDPTLLTQWNPVSGSTVDQIGGEFQNPTTKRLPAVGPGGEVCAMLLKTCSSFRSLGGAAAA